MAENPPYTNQAEVLAIAQSVLVGQIPDINLDDVYNYVDQIRDDLQNQVDRNITSWFYDYDPNSPNTLPTRDWTSPEIKNQHLGDLFYWLSTGYAYRFVVINGVYSWARLTDTDITQALAAAARAQDTADGKRRTFTGQPYTPYDVGDLWVDGVNLYACYTSRQTGAFILGDWGLATSYASQGYINAIRDSLQTQIDGNITSWFYDYEPTNNNAPANQWSDTNTRNQHLGDLFYWKSTGYAYRYMVDNGNYYWTRITDTDVTLALQTANRAQDTADGKRRAFNVQPYTPYDSGDLWTNGTDLYTCINGRQTGNFVQSDWQLATVYDSTEVRIAAGIVTAGTIILSNNTGQKAGITGSGGGDDAVRIWAGDTYSNRGIAPFIVQNDGTVFMTQAVIYGTINAADGKIGNFTIDGFGLKNIANVDAYIIQQRNYVDGSVREASIGTNIDTNGWVGVFANKGFVGGQNNGVRIAVEGGAEVDPANPDLTGNRALSVAGDISQFGGKVLIQGDIRFNGAIKVGGSTGFTGSRDIAVGGGGFKTFTWVNGILVSVSA